MVLEQDFPRNPRFALKWNKKVFLTINHLHISDLDSKMILFTGVRVGENIPFNAYFNENKIFSPIICSKFNVVTTCEFIICYKIILRFFLQSSNIYKLSENYTQIPKFDVLFLALARPCTILPAIREVTLVKTYNFRIKSEMYKKSISRSLMGQKS